MEHEVREQRFLKDHLLLPFKGSGLRVNNVLLNISYVIQSIKLIAVGKAIAIEFLLSGYPFLNLRDTSQG